MDTPPIWSVSTRSNLQRLYTWSNLILHTINASRSDLLRISERKCRQIECDKLQELITVYGNDLGSLLEWLQLGSLSLKEEIDIPCFELKPSDEKQWSLHIKGDQSNLKKMKNVIEGLVKTYKIKLDEIVEDDPFTDTEQETSESSVSTESDNDKDEEKK